MIEIRRCSLTTYRLVHGENGIFPQYVVEPRRRGTATADSVKNSKLGLYRIVILRPDPDSGLSGCKKKPNPDIRPDIQL